MLAKLEKQKRLFSIIFFAVSVVILTPIIFAINNDIFRVLTAVLLAAHFIAAVFYFSKGIASAVMCLIYLWLLGIGIAMPVVLSINITLSEFMTNGAFTTIGIVFFLTFTMAIPLPRKAKKFILKRLNNGEAVEEFTSRDIVLKSAGVKIKETEGTPYNAFISYRGGIQWNNLPYSLTRANPQMRKLRIITGISLFALCFIGLFLAAIFETDPTDPLPLDDWTFWAGMSSVVVLIAGAVVMLAGFIRGFIAVVGTASVLVLMFRGHDLIVSAWEKSFAAFIIIIVVLALMICIGFWKFLMFITRKQRRNFVVFEENACVYAVDIFLKDTCPIIGFVNCLRVDIAVADDARLKDFDAFNENLQAYCSNRKIIFAGAIINYEKQRYTVYLYYPFVKYEKKLRKYFKQTVKYPTEFISQADITWDIYKSELAPSDVVLIKLHNQQFISNLSDDFDFSIPHSIVMTAVFDDKDKTLSFMETINQQGYERIQFYDNSEYAEENNLIEKYYYHVSIQASLRMSEGWLNIETLKFNDFAKNAGGEYEFISLGCLGEGIQSENEIEAGDDA